MLYTLLVLGLLPAVLLPDMLSGSDDTTDENEPADETISKADLLADLPPYDILHDQIDGVDLATSAEETSDPSEDTAVEDDADEVLMPVNEIDEPSDLTDPKPDTKLVPLVEIDDPDAGDVDSQEILDPVIEIDTLLAGNIVQDATTPSTNDLQDSLVFLDETDALTPVEIDDFVTGQDILKIELSAELVVGDIDIEIVKSEDEAETYVAVEGLLVAILAGGGEVNTSDILVETVPGPIM